MLCDLALAPFAKIIRSPLCKHGMYIIHTRECEVYSRLWCVHEVDEAEDADVANNEGQEGGIAQAAADFAKAGRDEGAEEEEEEEEVLTPRSARQKRLLAKVRVTEYQINYVAEQCELEPGEAERRLRHHGGDVVAVLREHLAREDVDPEDDDAPIEGYEEWLRRNDFDDCLF